MTPPTMAALAWAVAGCAVAANAVTDISGEHNYVRVCHFLGFSETTCAAVIALRLWTTKKNLLGAIKPLLRILQGMRIR
jgi:hypothetical protein